MLKAFKVDNNNIDYNSIRIIGKLFNFKAYFISNARKMITLLSFILKTSKLTRLLETRTVRIVFDETQVD